ncbi:histidine phosphatase family protein, partial [Thermoproteota archaeon]
MTGIYLARHGQSVYNEQGIAQGQNDPDLTALGCVQAFDLGELLKEINFRHAYASDLKRAVQSFEHFISAYGRPLAIESCPELRERHFGQAQGRYNKDIGLTDENEQEFYALEGGVFTGGESIGIVRKRVSQKIIEIAEQPGPIIVIGHGWAISYTLNELLGQGNIVHPMDNSHFHYLNFEGPKLK